MPRRPQPQRLRAFHWPAPSGGINQVDPLGKMPLEDCVLAFNLVRGQYGLQVRTGHKEWCTGLTGGTDNSVRTLIPYSGSSSDGAKDKLWAVTAAAIYDVTSSKVVSGADRAWTFATKGGLSGYGQFCKFTTPGGHFVFYCDEVNGPFYYSETLLGWSQVGGEVPAAPWTGSTQVNAGDQVVNVGNAYQCITSGLTGTPASGGPTGTSASIADGAAAWMYLGAQQSGPGFFGPSLADQQNLYADNPGLFKTANFVGVVAWKSRLWFIEKNSTRAWYLPVNSVGGVLTSFDFGTKMQAGGPLANLYNWSFDGGSGLDTLLVAISTAGDVVIYQGTDPTQASTFGLQGVWRLPGVPFGRNIATDIGGDMAALSLRGLIPLSKLIIGNPTVDRTQYATYKVTPTFNQLAAAYGSQPGWSVMQHPQDNALLVAIPQPVGYQPLQLAMSFESRAWSQYRGLPINCGGVWVRQGSSGAGPQFFFGTSDGRICVSTGAVDGVQLADPTKWTAIPWSLLTSYQTGDDLSFKLVKQVRPALLSGQGATNLLVVPKFDYDIAEPPDTSSVGLPTGAAWDAGVWDSSSWQADLSPFVPTIGTSGMGRAVAIAIRGQSIAPTALVSLDVYLEQGGVM